MKKRILIAVLMIMSFLYAMLFAACGSKETMTLEKYVADNPDVQTSIDEATGDSNVKVEIKENEVIYSFDLATTDQFTEESAKSEAVINAIADALTAAGGTFGNISKRLEEQTGITGISTTVSYTWGDEVLVTKSFTAADAPETSD